MLRGTRYCRSHIVVSGAHTSDVVNLPCTGCSSCGALFVPLFPSIAPSGVHFQRHRGLSHHPAASSSLCTLCKRSASLNVSRSKRLASHDATVRGGRWNASSSVVGARLCSEARTDHLLPVGVLPRAGLAPLPQLRHVDANKRATPLTRPVPYSCMYYAK